MIWSAIFKNVTRVRYPLWLSESLVLELALFLIHSTHVYCISIMDQWKTVEDTEGTQMGSHSCCSGWRHCLKVTKTITKESLKAVGVTDKKAHPCLERSGERCQDKMVVMLRMRMVAMPRASATRVLPMCQAFFRVLPSSSQPPYEVRAPIISIL